MSIVPSFCTTVSSSVKDCFRRRAKAKVHEVLSPSGLSPEIEARVQGLPFMWQPKCRKILNGQTIEVQREQISVWEQLPDFTKTSTWPPSSTIFKELATVSMAMPMPTVVVEPEANMDVCSNWFRDVEYENDDDEEEEEEEFKDDADLRWFPREFIVPQTDHLPPRLCQVAVHSVVVENAPVIPEFSTLPSLPSLPSPPSSLIPLPLDVTEPLRPNGILGTSARSSIPLPVVFPPSHAAHSQKTASRPISYSGRWLSSKQEKTDTKPLGQHIPNRQEDDFRKLQGVSYDDFAKDLDKRHTTFNGTKALGQLPASVHPARPSSTTKHKVIGTSARRSYLSRRSTSSKENRQQVEATPLRKHIPTTLGVVSPEVEDVEFQWCHLAADISYGTFANGLDERRMSIDDTFVTQDWD